MDSSPYIVGIGGTVREGSSTEMALTCALRAAEAHGARTRIFAGTHLATLPHYDPTNASEPETAASLLRELRRSDGVIIASPGYHGSISGVVKNALDYTEDLSGDERPYLTDLPVGIIATGYGWQAIGSTIAALRSVAHALRGWPTPLAAGVRTLGEVFDGEGNCLDASAAAQLQLVGSQVASMAASCRAPC